MTGAEFEAIVAELKLNRGLAAKADIAAVAARLGLKATNVGDDCAVLPDGDGHLLFAMEGLSAASSPPTPGSPAGAA
jgi:selenophosphate synthetase-related protein